MIGQFQPEVGRRLSGHPITDKLVMAVNFSKPDPIVTLIGIPTIPEDTGVAGPGSYVSGNVTYTQGINRYGMWAGFSGAALNSKFDWTRSDFIPTTQGCTILMLYEKADATARASCAFILNVSGNPTSQIGANVPWVDGHVYFGYGGFGAGTSLDAGILTVTTDCWVFSVGGRGMEIWQNGIKRASNTDKPTRTASGSTAFVLGAKTADAIFSDIAHYNVFAMWARQLTTSEIVMVSADPYMLWDVPLTFFERGLQLEALLDSGVTGFAGGRSIFRRRQERWG